MKAHYYVYRHGNQAPTFRHETLEKAQAEAERLAHKHPGVEFEILVLLGASKVILPTMTTWVEEAPINQGSEFIWGGTGWIVKPFTTL